MSTDWSEDARYFEYSKAADPISLGTISKVPAETFSKRLYETCTCSKVILLDLSKQLVTAFPATSPSLLANFVKILKHEAITTKPIATSQLMYIIKGNGWSEIEGKRMHWETGDFITLPFYPDGVAHHASDETVMYWVHDEPLMQYLGSEPKNQRFKPTKFPRSRAVQELARVEQDPEAKSRSRISVLLANKNNVQTLTITPILWAMFGVLPAHSYQPAHRHQSVALDLILECEPGCYSLIGKELDEQGHIKDPIRIDWESYSAFVTPPGMWHSHHNESGSNAHLIPIQDAGLQTYLRTLDIQFSFVNEEQQNSSK